MDPAAISYKMSPIPGAPAGPGKYETVILRM